LFTRIEKTKIGKSIDEGISDKILKTIQIFWNKEKRKPIYILNICL
jgi:hypothetical protein